MKITDVGPVILLSFILITLLISAFEKINDWKVQMTFYRKLYSTTFLRGSILPMIILILGFEIIISTITALGIWDIVSNGDYVFASYALITASILFAVLLFGLRLIKDYSGAARIAVYFLVSIFGLYWVQSLISI